MAPKTTTESTADPATASYMRDIGQIPLLTHRQEQDCGLLIERKKYFEEIRRKARFPKEPNVALGLLKRIERQKTLIFALAQTRRHVQGTHPYPHSLPIRSSGTWWTSSRKNPPSNRSRKEPDRAATSGTKKSLSAA